MKDQTSNPVNIYIGKRVYKLRTEHGLTLDALARTINVIPAHLQAIETGTRRLPQSQMFKIAEALNIAHETVFAGLFQTIPLPALIDHTHYMQALYATFKRRWKLEDIISTAQTCMLK